MDIYIKLTKHCNLNCTYCFEREYLSNTHFMSITEMREIFEKATTYCMNNHIDTLNFIYTGGEVLLLGYDYLKLLFTIAEEFALKSRISISNSIQTNLTLIDYEIAALIKKHNVSISTSFDVVGKNRTYRNGVSIYKSMLDKFIIALKNEISFCSIVVLTKDNYKNAKEIYTFYKSINTNFNVIPLEPQSDRWVLDKMVSDFEHIEFLQELAELHISNHKRNISVLCIDDYINLIKKGPGTAHQCLFSEDIVSNYNLFLEPNGDVYPCSSLRFPDLYMGNIFHNSITQLFNSKVLKHLAERPQLVKQKCADCENYGLCFGGCMAFAYNEGNIFAPSKRNCTVNKAMFPFIRKLLNRNKDTINIAN